MPWSTRSIRWGVAICSVLLAVTSAEAQQRRAPTLAEAQRFMGRAETELLDLSVKAQRAEWVAETYITDDTEALTAEAGKNFNVAVVRLAGEARRFSRLRMPAALRRKFMLLRLASVAPPPADPDRREPDR